MPGAGTYVTPSLNHAGCVITTSGVFSFLFLFLFWQRHVFRVGQNHIYIYSVNDRIFGDSPANNTVYTPYMYGSGQPYMCLVQGSWVG